MDTHRERILLARATSEPRAAAAVTAELTAAAERLAQTFTRADDTWPMMWLVMAADGRATLYTAAYPGEDLSRRVAARARRTRAVAVGMLCSSWGGSATTRQIGSRHSSEILIQAPAHPRRATIALPCRQSVAVVVQTARTHGAHYAIVGRHGDAPATLGSFERYCFVAGPRKRIADLIPQALRAVG